MKRHQGEKSEKVSNMIGRLVICPISAFKIYCERDARGQTAKKWWCTDEWGHMNKSGGKKANQGAESYKRRSKGDFSEEWVGKTVNQKVED